jgi:hypothetical protein
MVFMIGRGIESGLGQGLGKLMNLGMGTEIIYSFVIIFCSLMIYFATKELYKLSSHKGIKYFRQSFLFFAFAYFFRSFIKIILFYFEINELRTFLPIFGSITLFIFMYFSSMAIFYLLYSVMWKKWESKSINLFHLVSLVIATTISLFNNSTIYFLINILFFVFISSTVYLSYKQSKKNKSHNLYIIYLLLFVFWIFNIIDILIPNYLQTFQLFIYLISLGIFLSILYKVIRKTG